MSSGTRRQFLRGLVATLAGADAVARGHDSGTVPYEQKMLRRVVRRAEGEALPVIGMGTWNTFDVGEQAQERAPLLEVLRIFLPT